MVNCRPERLNALQRLRTTSSIWLMPSVDQITGYKTSKKANRDSKANAEDNFEIIWRNVSKLIVSRNI